MYRKINTNQMIVNLYNYDNFLCKKVGIKQIRTFFFKKIRIPSNKINHYQDQLIILTSNNFRKSKHIHMLIKQILLLSHLPKYFIKFKPPQSAKILSQIKIILMSENHQREHINSTQSKISNNTSTIIQSNFKVRP